MHTGCHMTSGMMWQLQLQVSLFNLVIASNSHRFKQWLPIPSVKHFIYSLIDWNKSYWIFHKSSHYCNVIVSLNYASILSYSLTCSVSKSYVNSNFYIWSIGDLKFNISVSVSVTCPKNLRLLFILLAIKKCIRHGKFWASPDNSCYVICLFLNLDMLYLHT